MSNSELLQEVIQQIKDITAELAELKAELKKIEDLARKDKPKSNVSFQSLDVPVTHWQRLEKKKIRISASTTFLDFKRRIRTSFSEEITTKIFRVYKLPHKFTSIDERVLIDDEAKFQECVEWFTNPDEFPPELYIWNYEDESPNKPNTTKDRECSSVVSRDSNQSKICKEKDGYVCLCCGYFGAEGMSMKCCHLYEIKAHKALTTLAVRKEKLKSLKLVDINELRNLVTMCENCHTRFDNHQIGIHPADLRWIITDALRDKSTPSSKPYHDIHGQRVVFAIETYAPPVEVLEDRMLHFMKNMRKSIDKTIHYCHFCLETFSGVAGLNNKESHVAICRVITIASELSL